MSTESSVTSFSAALPSRQGRTSTGAGSGDDAQRQLAWQREMERAQMAGWFKPAVAGSNEASAEAAQRAGDTHARGRSGNEKSRGAGHAAPTVRSAATGLQTMESPMVSPSAGGRVDAGTLAVRAAIGLSSQSPVAVETDANPTSESRIDARLTRRAGMPMVQMTQTPSEDGADAASDACQAAPQEPCAPVRLHEEATPQGQAVWIAMRADDEALTAMLPQLVADLRQGLQQRGQRLHQVVCNGRLVWRDGAAVAPEHPFISRTDDNRRAVSGSIDSPDTKEA